MAASNVIKIDKTKVEIRLRRNLYKDVCIWCLANGVDIDTFVEQLITTWFADSPAKRPTEISKDAVAMLDGPRPRR